MKPPFEFAVRAPSAEQAAHAAWWWNVTDRLVKFTQWIFFLSLLIYANTKVRSTALTLVIIVLLFAMFKALTSAYEQYIRFNMSDHITNVWIAGAIKLGVVIVFGGLSVLLGISVISALVKAFLKFQMGK